MKRFKNILAGVIALVTVFVLLTGCSEIKQYDYVIKIGDIKVDEEEYVSVAKMIKSNFLSQNNIEDTESSWTQYTDETYSTTLEEYVNALIQSYIIEYTVYSMHFDELGLKLPDEKVSEIDANLKTYVDQYGSREKLNAALEKQGFSYDRLEKQYYDEAKRAMVVNYYFGDEGKKVPVNADDLYAYYSKYYTRVKHVFLSTKDKEGADLVAKDREPIGKKAQMIYDKAKNGADFDGLIDEYNEDPGMASAKDGYVFSSDDTSYNHMFYTAAFDMEPGEIRLVQSNLGYHIMTRIAFTKEEVSEPKTKQTLIENMMGTEISTLTNEIKEQIGVDYNNKALERLTATKIETIKTEDGETESGNVISTEDILDYVENK